MTTTTINRRDFLKVFGASVGALVVGQMLPIHVAEAAKEAGMLDINGDGYISTMCEMCVWRCGVRAKVKEGRVVKLKATRCILIRWAFCARAANLV